MNENLYEALGGYEILEKVHKTFYDKLYAHPWLKHFFEGIDRAMIEKQQSDFMTSVMGGPNFYSGKSPKFAHQHIFLTDEIFEIRSVLLKESILENGLSEELASRWLEKDRSFYPLVVKKSLEECTERYASEGIITFPKSS
jgi:hemoglobin